MFIDMVGYALLGQRDEFLSLTLLNEHWKLLRPIFVRHNGREVKTIGDAFLVEFPSALDAVRCAYDIQRVSREFNISLPSEKRVQLRVGVHVGDVVEAQGDIFGDAVNVASRIEPLAGDGGISLSQQVYDQVQNKFELPLVSLGKKSLKNVSGPIEVYQVVLPWEKPKQVEQEALDKRRLAVLPLANISADPNDEYFADGLTEEVISTISKVHELSVISRTSAMKYKGVSKTVKEIGSELQAGAILEGSVRKVGNTVRIAVQLIDVIEDKHLWAQSYDRELENIFAIQSDIARQVAEALRVQLLSAEKREIERKATESTEAYTLYLKGRYYWNERTLDGLNKAIQYFQEAIKRDPNYARAYAGLADCYGILENHGYLSPSEAYPKMEDYANKALQIDSTLAEAHTSLATVLNRAFEWDKAEQEFKHAIDLNPNYATARHFYAFGNLRTRGRWDEALSQIRKAQELDPLSSQISTNAGDILLEAGHLEHAIKQYREVIESDPGFVGAHIELGLALIAKCLFNEGIKEIERGQSLQPERTSVLADLVYAYASAGRTEEAQRLVDELREVSKEKRVTDLDFAIAYASLGKKDLAFDYLNKAADEHSSQLIVNISTRYFLGLHSDARFQDLLKRIGLK